MSSQKIVPKSKPKHNKLEGETETGAAWRQLMCARHLIKEQETWCQGKDRFREAHSLLDILSIVGADGSYGHNRNKDGEYPGDLKRDEIPDAIWFVRKALNSIAPEFGGLIGKWNDAPRRKHKEVISLIDNAIRLVDYEHSLNLDGDEAPDTPNATHSNNPPQDNLNVLHVSGPQCGMFNLPVHYTLGRGLAEELGEDLLDIAVFTAFREAAKVGNQSDLNRHEFDFRGLHDLESTGIAVEAWWDKRARCVCLHLELVRTEASIWQDDWEDVEKTFSQGRSIN